MVRRAIVVTHSVGTQEKGQTLNDIVEPLVRFLQRFSGRPGHPQALQLDVDMRPDQGSARAMLQFEANGQRELWLITEAWWAERFFPGPREAVLRWGFEALFRHGWSIIYGIIGPPLCLDTVRIKDLIRTVSRHRGARVGGPPRFQFPG